MVVHQAFFLGVGNRDGTKARPPFLDRIQCFVVGREAVYSEFEWVLD